MTIAFVLASWRPDVPAGMERATIAHATALHAAGHDAIIITADPHTPDTYHGVPIITLNKLNLAFPCDDDTLRHAITTTDTAITAELRTIFDTWYVTAAVYVDALWGLGRLPHHHPHVRNILAMHVVGHDQDLTAALSNQPTAVIAPSQVVLDLGAARGYDTRSWTVVANTLLHPPPDHLPDGRRGNLRTAGPVRILARLGAEKGVAELLAAHLPHDPDAEVALAAAPFETSTGSQDLLLARCEQLTRPGISLRGGMPWKDVPGWLAGAAAVIVPSRAETFGLVALEAMAAGTPVVAYDVGNLPHLIGDGGMIVDTKDGPAGLWRATRHLLGGPVRYRQTSRAAYYRSRDYWPALVANQLLKVVS